MRQGRELNFTGLPQRRTQAVGTRPESDYASVSDTGSTSELVADLLTRMSDLEDRVTALEGGILP